MLFTAQVPVPLLIIPNSLYVFFMALYAELLFNISVIDSSLYV